MIVRASQIVPQAVSWLWKDRLALGKLSLVEGDPDRGKSFLMCDLAARLSTGAPWPDGTATPGPASVLLLSAEDDSEDTLVPRLLAAGANLDRVHVRGRLKRLAAGDAPSSAAAAPSASAASGSVAAMSRPSSAPLLLPRGLPRLDELLAQTDARLLILDPLPAFLDPALGAGSDAAVRAALTPLAEVAQERRCAVVLLRHLVKRRMQSSLYQGAGSIAFLALCRSAWLVGKHPALDSRSVLAQIKNNLAEPQPSLAFELFRPDQGGSLPRLRWHGPAPISAAELIAASAEGAGCFEAKCFLKEFLKDGPRVTREIFPAAKQAGLKRATLYRARAALKITMTRLALNGLPASIWSLPGQAAPEDPLGFLGKRLEF